MKFDFSDIDRSGTHSVKYERRAAKFGDASVMPLWVADMDVAAAPCVVEAIANRATHPIYGYTEYPDAFFASIVAWYDKRYGVAIEPEWIVPAFGVVPSLGFCVEAFSEAGEGAIVQPPVYPPFYTTVKRHGRKVIANPLRLRNGRYEIDFEDLQRKAKAASLLLFCSPHNPVGRAWEAEALKRLVEICRENDVTIVSDEIHGDIVLKGEHRSLLAYDEHAVILHAPSKSFNVAGLNTSFAVIPDTHMRRRYRVAQERSGLSLGNPFGIEATIAAFREGEAWLEALLAHLRRNRAYVEKVLNANDVLIRAVDTEATFLMWLDCRALGLSQEALERCFVEKAHLGLNSGTEFGEEGEGFMRLNIGVSFERLQHAMQGLIDAIEEVV